MARGSMATFSQNEGTWRIEAEADLSAAAAVTATRGTNTSCAKTGTGQYTFTVVNPLGAAPNSLAMIETLFSAADVRGAPATAFWAVVRSITQNGSNAIVVVVETVSNAATPVAADVTAGCTVTLSAVLRCEHPQNPY